MENNKIINTYQAAIMSRKYEEEKYSRQEQEAWKIIEEDSLIYGILLSAIKDGEFQIRVPSLDDKTINAFKVLGYQVKKVKRQWYIPNRRPYVIISWDSRVGDYC